jgi:hypothetical protein
MAEIQDDNSLKIVNDALFFCADPSDELFYLFVLSSKDKTGEMKTRSYDYQDPANSEPWFAGDGTFASAIEEIAATVREHALEEAD